MIVIFAYTGWAAYASLYIFRPQSVTAPGMISVIFSIVLVILFAYLSVQQSPWTFYVYVLFPWYFWGQVIPYTVLPACNFFLGRGRNASSYLWYVLEFVLVFAVLQGMVVSCPSLGY